MEGTPKAKARRQSLPSQHFLSSPQTASDKIPSHAELIRFRDEMGIDSQAYLHAHPPQSYAQLSDQAATTSSNSNSRLKMVRGTIASKGSPSGSHRISMKPETNDIRFDGPSGSAGTLNGEGGAKKKVRKKWTIEETKMLVEGCNKVRAQFVWPWIETNGRLNSMASGIGRACWMTQNSNSMPIGPPWI